MAAPITCITSPEKVTGQSACFLLLSLCQNHLYIITMLASIALKCASFDFLSPPKILMDFCSASKSKSKFKFNILFLDFVFFSNTFKTKPESKLTWVINWQRQNKSFLLAFKVQAAVSVSFCFERHCNWNFILLLFVNSNNLDASVRKSYRGCFSTFSP